MSTRMNPSTTAFPIHSGTPKTAVYLALLVAASSARAWGAEITINDPAVQAGYQVYSYTASSGPLDVSIIGVYETRNDHAFFFHPQGTATIHFEYTFENGVGRPTHPLVLVLSSYEPNRWVLDYQGDPGVEQIILNGYHRQEVENAGAIPILNLSGHPRDYIVSCARAWPSSTGGCDTHGLVAGIEEIVGQPITAFAGTYRATDFSIGSSTSYETTTGTSTDTPRNPTADLTGNGTVDFEDVTILLSNWNTHASIGEGNLVGWDSSVVNFGDLTYLLSEWTGSFDIGDGAHGGAGDDVIIFGDGPAPSPEAVLGMEAVPEPSGLLLALLATLGLSFYRRRRA